MRKGLLGLAFVLVSGAASASDFKRISESQALTRADPSATPDATFAFPMSQARGFRVTVCADSGQTLVNVTLRAWHYSFGAGLWARNPALDQTATAVGKRCVTFPDFRVSVAAPSDWAMFASDATTVSSGTVTIHYLVWME